MEEADGNTGEETPADGTAGVADEDVQENILNEDGSIYAKKASSIDEIGDKDFEESTRSV